MERSHEGLSENDADKLVRTLNKAVLFSVRVLAILMVVVIYWALADVIIHLYWQLLTSITSIFNIDNLFNTLGAFLAVLIAIEVFLNIIFYLKKDAIHVPLVLATALTAIARKVIVLDYQQISTDHMYATAALVLAIGISYWLITKKSD